MLVCKLHYFLDQQKHDEGTYYEKKQRLIM